MFFEVIRAQLDFYKQELEALDASNQRIIEFCEDSLDSIQRNDLRKIIRKHNKITRLLKQLYRETKFL